jgi:hypothetical protein
MAAVVRLRYVGPHDAVVIPGIPDPVQHGQEFDCGGSLAAGLLDQPGNYERVNTTSKGA